jgi:2-oxoacid:acceptor oxidoreductase gamma subunit (pyruvate/2-ketoisovalerate family)
MSDSPATAGSGTRSDLRELRIHGRGGQGAVLASKVLASALFSEGRSVQAFPAFGVERRGAPVTAFLRYSSGEILLRCEIQEPDDLIILDPTLIKAIDVTQGLKAGGSILINSDRAPETYANLTKRFRVSLVDASGIARRRGLGSKTQPVVNTAILGAFAADSGVVGLEAICSAIAETMAAHAERNIEAAREAAAAVVRISHSEVQHAG